MGLKSKLKKKTSNVGLNIVNNTNRGLQHILGSLGRSRGRQQKLAIATSADSFQPAKVYSDLHDWSSDRFVEDNVSTADSVTPKRVHFYLHGDSGGKPLDDVSNLPLSRQTNTAAENLHQDCASSFSTSNNYNRNSLLSSLSPLNQNMLPAELDQRDTTISPAGYEKMDSLISSCAFRLTNPSNSQETMVGSNYSTIELNDRKASAEQESSPRTDINWPVTCQRNPGIDTCAPEGVTLDQFDDSSSANHSLTTSVSFNNSDSGQNFESLLDAPFDGCPSIPLVQRGCDSPYVFSQDDFNMYHMGTNGNSSSVAVHLETVQGSPPLQLRSLYIDIASFLRFNGLSTTSIPLSMTGDLLLSALDALFLHSRLTKSWFFASWRPSKYSFQPEEVSDCSSEDLKMITSSLGYPDFSHPVIRAEGLKPYTLPALFSYSRLRTSWFSRYNLIDNIDTIRRSMDFESLAKDSDPIFRLLAVSELFPPTSEIGEFSRQEDQSASKDSSNLGLSGDSYHSKDGLEQILTFDHPKAIHSYSSSTDDTTISEGSSCDEEDMPCQGHDLEAPYMQAHVSGRRFPPRAHGGKWGRFALRKSSSCSEKTMLSRFEQHPLIGQISVEDEDYDAQKSESEDDEAQRNPSLGKLEAAPLTTKAAGIDKPQITGVWWTKDEVRLNAKVTDFYNDEAQVIQPIKEDESNSFVTEANNSYCPKLRASLSTDDDEEASSLIAKVTEQLRFNYDIPAPDSKYIVRVDERQPIVSRTPFINAGGKKEPTHIAGNFQMNDSSLTDLVARCGGMLESVLATQLLNSSSWGQVGSRAQVGLQLSATLRILPDYKDQGGEIASGGEKDWWLFSSDGGGGGNSDCDCGGAVSE